jgi:putative ABC transport system permease protein
MSGLVGDLRYSLRKLFSDPSFSLVVIITFALAIGANSTIFSFANAILIQPLPYGDSDRLVRVFCTNYEKGIEREWTSAPDYVDWEKQSETIEQWIGSRPMLWNVTGEGEAEVVHGFYVTPGICRFLGVQPFLGRDFSPEEESPKGNPVALIYYSFWQRRFGGDPGALGKQIRLSERPYTIVGVMPRSFLFPNREAEVLVPLGYDLTRNKYRGGRWLRVLAKLKPGVTVEQAQTEMNLIARRLSDQYRETNKGWGIRVVSLSKFSAGEFRPALLILLCAVGLVLLIACANVASLLLARGVTYQKELAIRSAIGASRLVVLRRILGETLLLSGVGGVAGLLLAWAAVRYLLSRLPAVTSYGNERITLEYVRVDAWVIGFTVLLAVLAATLASLFPVWQMARLNLTESLKDIGTTSAGGYRTRRLHRSLVIGEVALAVVLVIGAGLMVQSLRRLLRVDPGFRKDNVLTLNTFAIGSKYRSAQQGRAFYREIRDRVAALPGVSEAATISHLPFFAIRNYVQFQIKDRPAPPPGQEPQVLVRMVSPRCFAALGVPLLRGRDFTEADLTGARGVAIVNREFARRWFPQAEPVGKQITLGSSRRTGDEIVGVVGDLRDAGLDAPPRPEVYLPHGYGGYVNLVIHTDREPLRFVPQVQSIIRSIDPDIPTYRISTLEKLLADRTWSRRTAVLMLSNLAGLALFLAALGVYGLMQYSVSQQTREIGIRMALGATEKAVTWQIVARGLRMGLAGVATGLLVSFGVARALSSQLYGIEPTDPGTYAAAAGILLTVVLVASYIPARRATKVDPLVALRHE